MRSATTTVSDGARLVERGVHLGASSTWRWKVDEHLIVGDLHWVDLHRLDGRQVQHRAGRQVEPRTVSPAFDGAIVDVTFRQRHRFVRALVVYGEHACVRAHEADG